MDNNKVFVIILNWNGWEDTIECLESFQKVDYPDYQMVVVDNGSTDGSVKKMIEWTQGKISVNTKPVVFSPELKPLDYVVYNKPVAEAGGDGSENSFCNLPPDKRIVFIKNDKNYGYAEGNNTGIRYALKKDADFIFILNNDTVVDKNILQEFSRAYRKFPKACYGAKIYYYDNTEKIWSSGVKWNRLRMKFIHQTEDKRNTEESPYVAGAALFLPREVLGKTGLFDPRLFLWDETDLCLRAKEAGYKILLVSSAVVFHKVSSSFKRSSMPTEYFSARSGFLWAEKHLGVLERMWFLLNFLFELLNSLRYSLGLTKEYLFFGEKPKERTTERFLRLSMKLKGFRDYLLRRFDLKEVNNETNCTVSCED